VGLLRGNGNRNAMVLIGRGNSWDLEKMATCTSESLAETTWLLSGLVVLWTCLLITVSGLKENTWFLVLIGGIGMVQNIYASTAKRSAAALSLSITPYKQRETIIGSEFTRPYDDENSDEDVEDKTNQWREALNTENTAGVAGAIQELEKVIPKAGVALMLEFFPAIMRYESDHYRTNSEKKFWKKAFREFGKPVAKTYAAKG
jgi:hypothetical protein